MMSPAVDTVDDDKGRAFQLIFQPASPLLSTCMTARIQCSGTLKRRDASAMYEANALGAVAKPFDVLLPAEATNENVTKLTIKTASMQAVVLTRRKPAGVLGSGQGKARTRRAEGHPSSRCPKGGPKPKARAAATLILARKEEKSGSRSNRGIADCSRKIGLITSPRRSREEPHDR